MWKYWMQNKIPVIQEQESSSNISPIGHCCGLQSEKNQNKPMLLI